MPLLLTRLENEYAPYSFPPILFCVIDICPTTGFRVILLPQPASGNKNPPQLISRASASNFSRQNSWHGGIGSASLVASDLLEEPKETLEALLRSMNSNNNNRCYLSENILRTSRGKDGGMRTDYAVKKVLNHRSAAKQLKLPFMLKDDDFS